MTEKYNEVVTFIKNSNAKYVNVSNQNNVTRIEAEVDNQATKNKIWDKIKQIGGENPKDIQADIRISQTQGSSSQGAGTVHKVKSGETLSGISKQYLGDANRYKEIASYNDISDPDKINVGQEIRIPNK